jgi:hypothetical protein
MTDLDRETTQAVDALTHRLRNHLAAVRNGGDCEDPEVFAAEFITAMRGKGWRPTEARLHTAPPPVVPGSGARPPADLLAEARARFAEATARKDAAAARRDAS